MAATFDPMRAAYDPSTRCPSAITVLVLDSQRHFDIIHGVRSTGAAVRLVTDGDVAAAIHCTDPENTGVDMYIGTGGVLATASARHSVRGSRHAAWPGPLVSLVT